ncbi:magnesium transporter CorA family protein [bacterium]|nr:magnesium transporter CorA family protein [bacterium]
MHKSYKLLDGRIVEDKNEEDRILIYVNPDETEKRYLIDELKLDEHTLNSVADPDELPRLEFEPDHVALIFKRPKSYQAKDLFFFKVTSTGIYLFKNRLVVVCYDEAPSFEGKHFMKINSLAEVVLKIIYRTIYHFNEHLKIINMLSEELEGKINASMGNKYLINLFTLEKSLVYYLNAINANGVVIEKLRLNSAKIGFSAFELELIEDILIDSNQCSKQAEIYSNILAGLMDARVSIVSNNLNIIMKTLTIITLGIMLPTFVVSAFSMNVPLPLKAGPYTYWIILGMALISAAGVFLLWKLKKW